VQEKLLVENTDVEFDESYYYLAQVTDRQRAEPVRHTIETFRGWETVPGANTHESKVWMR
jgi:hypothetical protein